MCVVVSCVMMPRSTEGGYPEDGGDEVLQNVSNHRQDCTAL
jgi:hypothetical protein